MKNKTLFRILIILLLLMICFFITMLSLQAKSINRVNETKEQIQSITFAFTDVFAANATLTNTPDPFLYRQAWQENWIEFVKAYTVFDEKLGKSRTLSTDPELIQLRSQEKRILGRLQDHVDTINTGMDALVTENPGYAPPLLDGASSGIKGFKDEIVLINTLGTYLNELFYDRLYSMIGEINRVSSVELRRLQLLTMSLSIAVSLAILAFLVLISGRITRNIGRLGDAMQKIKERDLSSIPEVVGTDEIAATSAIFRELVIDLRAVFESIQMATDTATTQRATTNMASHESAAAINEVHSNIESINAQIRTLIVHITGSIEAVSRINASILELGNNTAAQDVAIGQSTSAIEEIEASIANIAKITEQRKHSVIELERTTAKNGEVLDEAVEQIGKNAQDTASIHEILEIIDQIAGQTNILSMNAAIEAAHAGAAGKGFAVVADEIGKLAASTNQYASEIKTVIMGISERASAIQNQTEQLSAGYRGIIHETRETVASMTEISETIAELSHGSNDIMTAMIHLREQSKGIRTHSQQVSDDSSQVETAITTVGDVGIQVERGMDEIAGAIADINKSLAAINDMHAENDEAMTVLSDKASAFTLSNGGQTN